MTTWLRNALIVLVAIGVAGGAGYFWFVGDGAPPADAPAFTIDIAAIRVEADKLPGGKTSEIRVEAIDNFTFPATGAVAGDGFDNVAMAAYSFQLILPTDTVVIDTGFVTGEAGNQLFPATESMVDEDAAARMEMALGTATQIVVTHEHPDHIGGLVAAYGRSPAIARAIRLTPEQLANAGVYAPAWREAFADMTAVAYDTYLTIAPGIVLIRAPGHSPGGQMIYVKRADGRELLFVGDIAWLMRNIETGRGRPRVVSDFLVHEDRIVVFSELRALQQLHESEPDVLIVPGHDTATVNGLLASGAMAAQFKF